MAEDKEVDRKQERMKEENHIKEVDRTTQDNDYRRIAKGIEHGWRKTAIYSEINKQCESAESVGW